ncbi:MAG: DUF1700 domain-containing protein [Clostridia bacterium]|nr:DUF1700 domain-containing protein [Clostridia bacterium]
MTYKTWERRLKKELKTLPKSERERVVEYYREMRDEMESYGRSEQSVLSELGSPESCARKALSEGDYAVTGKVSGQNRPAPKKGYTFFEVIGLLLITLLLVLPFGGAAIGIIAGFAGVCIGGLAAGIAGIVAAVAYPIYIGGGAAGIAGIGACLAAAGVGFILFVVFFLITKYAALVFLKVLKAIYIRR